MADTTSSTCTLGAMWGLKGNWKIPHQHQIDCVVKARGVVRGYADLPCGSGKTLVCYMLANDQGAYNDPPRNVLIVGGSRSTSTQLYTNGCQNTSLDQSLEYAFEQKEIRLAPSTCERRVHVTSYAFILSLHNQPFAERMYTTVAWDLIVLDEVHQAMGAQTWKCLQRIIRPTSRVIGLTGTPYRTPTPNELDKSATSAKNIDQNSSFLDALGPRFFQVSIKDLGNKGLIAKLNFKFLTVPMDDSMRNGKYEMMPATERRDAAALNSNKALAIAKIVSYHRARKETGIIFIQKLACADALSQMIRNVKCMDGGVVMVGATSEEKATEHNQRLQKALGMLERNEIPFLILSQAYEFGIDVPSIRYVAMSDGPGASVRSDTQRTGRVCRNATLGHQKEAVVYSLSMADTHEIHEKQSFVNNLRAHGFTEADISTSLFDVAQAKEELGVDDTVLVAMSNMLLQRQEKNAGKRKEKKIKKDIANERSVLRLAHTIREQKAHPLFKSKVKQSNKSAASTLRTQAFKRLTDANMSGRAEYLCKIQTTLANPKRPSTS